MLKLKDLVNSNKMVAIAGKSGVDKTSVLLRMSNENTVFFTEEISEKEIKSMLEKFNINENIKLCIISKNDNLKDALNKCINDRSIDRIILDHTILTNMDEEKRNRFLKLLDHSGKSIVVGIQAKIQDSFESINSFGYPFDLAVYIERYDECETSNNINLLRCKSKALENF